MRNTLNSITRHSLLLSLFYMILNVTAQTPDYKIGCISGDCQNGKGTYVNPDSSIYIGEWKDGLKNGKGKLSAREGRVDVGEWKDNKKNGHFFVEFKNKSSIGFKYDLMYVDDKANGQGLIKYYDDTMYCGTYKDDMPNGYGIRTYGGERYSGEWKDGKKNGLGTLVEPSGNGIFVGTWKDNNKVKGTLTRSNGDIYVGDWKNNKKDGQGTYSFKDGQKYIGEWKDGFYNGHGTMIFSNGDSYTGEWKIGKQDGEGTYTYANGIKYSGVWVDGKQNDKGNYSIPKGVTWEKQNDVISNSISEPYFKYVFKFKNYYPDMGVEGTLTHPYIKVFRNIIANNSTIFSLVYSPRSRYYENYSYHGSDFGTYLTKTSLENGITDWNTQTMDYYNVYKGNNQIKDLNKIFYIQYSTAYNSQTIPYLFGAITVNGKQVESSSFKMEDQFELNNKGNVETYKTSEAIVGNDIIAYRAISTFSHNDYIFVNDFKSPTSPTKIDLSLYSTSFHQYRDGCVFKGQVGDKSIERAVSLYRVFRNNQYRYVFVRLNEDYFSPVRIDINDGVTIYPPLNIPIPKGNTYSSVTGYRDNNFEGIFFMPSSQGFIINIAPYELAIKPTNIKYYNSQFSYKWEMNLNDLMIRHIYESGDYIIVGGYCLNKGFLGYPNPKVIVINRITKQITYEKVLAQKNSEISFIGSNDSGGIVLGVGTYCCKDLETDTDLKPYIIIDSLNTDGVFENDLFDIK